MDIEQYVNLGICVLILIVGGYIYIRYIDPFYWVWQGSWSTVMAGAIVFVWPPPEQWITPLYLYTMAFVFFATLRKVQSDRNMKGEFYEVDSKTIDAFFDDSDK